MNAVCLIIDGLSTSFLGPYGNSWVPTVEFNRLAANGCLFDQAFIDSPRLESLYRSFWTGLHAQVKPSRANASALAARLSGHGVHSLLVSDDSLIVEHPLAQEFRSKMWIRSTRDATAPRASEIGATELAHFFAEVIEQLQGRLDEPFLLWAHTSSLARCWDAPWELCQQLLTEEGDDIESIESRLSAIQEPPHALLGRADPDDLLAYRVAYAAQVRVLDTCLAALDQAFVESGLESSTLRVVLGARGFPLGQHMHLGFERPQLNEELIHIPWLIRAPDQQDDNTRLDALVQPGDLNATLIDWFKIPDELSPEIGRGRSLLPLMNLSAPQLRDRILITDEATTTAIRTAGWYLLKENNLDAVASANDGTDSTSLDEHLQLFIKPDDRWEINEVAARCPRIVESLAAALTELEHAVSENAMGNLAPLDEPTSDHLS